MSSLDREIHEAFNLISLMLVFVFGYFAAFFPQADEVIEVSMPPGASQAERAHHVRRLRSYRLLVGGTTGLACASLGFLTPLTVRLIADWSWEYSVPRMGLLLIDVMIVALLVINIWLMRRLTHRIADFHS